MWSCVFFEKLQAHHMILLLGILTTGLFGTSCIIMGKDQQTADGQVIPGKKMFQLAEYEYVCELTMGRNYTEMEQLLDRYGANGWKLSGFMQKGGDTYAFCMMR